jgi:hypothetical protein
MNKASSLRLAAVVVAISCSVLLVGGVLINRAGAKQLNEIGGCPSSHTPRPPQGTLKDSGTVTIGLPPSAVGCWEAYADLMSADDVYHYYSSSASSADWRVVYAYPQTGTVRLASKRDGRLLVDLSITSGGRSIAWGTTRTRIDISICRCDPALMKG